MLCIEIAQMGFQESCYIFLFLQLDKPLSVFINLLNCSFCRDKDTIMKVGSMIAESGLHSCSSSSQEGTSQPLMS